MVRPMIDIYEQNRINLLPVKIVTALVDLLHCGPQATLYGLWHIIKYTKLHYKFHANYAVRVT